MKEMVDQSGGAIYPVCAQRWGQSRLAGGPSIPAISLVVNAAKDKTLQIEPSPHVQVHPLIQKSSRGGEAATQSSSRLRQRKPVGVIAQCRTLGHVVVWLALRPDHTRLPNHHILAKRTRYRHPKIGLWACNGRLF